MLRSYVLQTVAIAPIVILAVAMISPHASHNYSAQRIAATALGGAVVIVFGYLIWPHSRRAWVSATFASTMESIATQLKLAASPIPDDEAGVTRRHNALVAARRNAARSLSDLRVRLQRASGEPPPAGAVAAA